MEGDLLNKNDVIFFMQNKYFKYPRYLQIEITNRCGLNCPQCYKESSKPRDMDLNLFSNILSEAQKLGVTTVYLNGGEPFIHKEIIHILNMLRQYNFKVYCFSSGLGITEEILNEIKKIKEFYLTISLNGSTEKINQLSRDGFEVTVAAMEILQKSQYSYGINWVCRHDNVHDLHDLIYFIMSKGAKWINISGNKLTGEGMLVSPMEPADYLYLKKLIEKFSKEDRKFVRVQYCFNILNDLIDRPVNKRLNGCNAGVVSCCVNVEGEYMPCTHLYYSEEFCSIRDYWNNSLVLQQLRNARLNKKKCSKCNKDRECYFCRAMSIETYTNFEADFGSCPLLNFYD